RIAQQTGSTLFMVLECLYAVLISRHGHSGDVVLGTPVANRPHEDIGGLIGYFVNMLVLRHQVDQNISFLDLLAQVKQDVIEAFAYEQVPFDKVVRAAVKQRSASFSPLVQLIITLQNNAIAPFSLPGLACVLKQPEKSHCLFDLQLEATETPAGMTLHWEYDSDLFREASIARFADHFARLAAQVINDPDCALGKHDLLSGQERRQQLFEWNDTARDFPRESCIQELFEQRAQATPDAVAVRVEGQQLSYAALNAQANQLAHYLVTQRQVKPDTLVGICVERSLEMVIGILGILKAGGAYVPLDPDYPPARLAYMLDDAKLTTVLTQTHVRETTTISAAQALCMDDAQVRTQLSTQPVTNIAAASLGLTASHLAYAIYTSGSTGNPKASLLNHSGLCNLALGQGAAFAVTPESRVLQFASIAFDAATSEWCMALAHGASIVVLSNATAKSPDALSALVEQHRVTHATLPPVLLPLLKVAQWKSVHTLVVAGDACSDQMARLWSADRHFINAYGPSETTVCATVGSYQADRRRLHIGKPLQNVKVYVLTQGQDLAPQGVAGELHIGGVGLSRGYLNRPELTGEKFIVNPFHDAADPASSERLYKAGDLVRWLADGNLEFLGRIDHQVKIRGFRIELGEIENALASHARVNDAVVLARDCAAGDKRLVAYVVARVDESEAALIDELRRHLAAILPDYMVPAAFVLLASLPLTPNGKVDRKALPEPDASQQQAAYGAPRTEAEQLLCTLWQEVLGLERVGITDNFFRLGGHSLSATRLVARINQAFEVVLPLRAVFQSQTLEALAREVAQLEAGCGLPPLQKMPQGVALLPSYAQQRLWLLDRIAGGSAHYNMPAAMKLEGVLDQHALDQAFTTILARHESLRTCLVEGADGQPVQVIQTAAPFTVAVTDLSALADGERQARLAELVTQEADRVFDLGRDRMLRARLLKIAPGEHILLATMHHIASDGWSMAILTNEFSTLYRAYALGQPDPLPPLAIQYADYAHWQRNWLQGDVLEQQLGYWTGQLANLPVVHSLPLDRPRPALQGFAGAMHASRIDAGTSDQLNALCQGAGATLFMGLHAAFSVLLARYSHESDIVVGSTIANREQAEVAGLIGFFINTLILRSDLSGDPSFIDLLGQSKT
ncbi:MAG: amino acid adenylation domain-containing protein, partial [Telluria sp.]